MAYLAITGADLKIQKTPLPGFEIEMTVPAKNPVGVVIVGVANFGSCLSAVIVLRTPHQPVTPN
jgi:hypothetical protein